VIERKDLSIKDGKVFSFHAVAAKEVIDIAGLCVSHGFIDSHLHVEGLHLLPQTYSQLFLARGTTTIVTDLHEIANAGGLPGVMSYLKLLDTIPLEVLVMAPSCVPSCAFERGLGKMGIKELTRLKGHKRVIGLGEVMDVDGVLERRQALLRKIQLFAGKPIDGHAPLLSGEALQAYLSAGIHSDHETTSLEEGREKLTYGMHLFARQGSVSKDLYSLLPLVEPPFLEQVSLCTDDLSVQDLVEHGHIDAIIRHLLGHGMPLARALRLATVNPSAYFNLSDRKGLVMGAKADLVIFDPADVLVRMTLKDGKVVYREGEALPPQAIGGASPSKMKIADYTLDDLRQKTAGSTINVIGVREGTLLSEHLVEQARVEDGYVMADVERDILYAYVFDRYHARKHYGSCFVRGFGLRGGAMGTTYAHDSHNLVIVGDNLVDIHAALTALKNQNGGMVLAQQGNVIEHIPMPYYGIISNLSADEYMQREKKLRRVLVQMGVTLSNPFFTMSFLSLPVIPALRLTTRGLFHVTEQRHIPASCT
jgi:adenine deaminase